MLISLSPTKIPSLVSSLTPSDVKLTPQPMSDAAKQALLDARNAGVTPPVTSVEPQPGTGPIVAVNTVIGPPQSSEFPRLAELHKGVTEALKNSFEDFKSALSYLYPDLADKKFGFTVAEDGSLKALNDSGELSATDMERLNTLLNASSDLKSAAVTYRDSAIDLVNADSAWTGSYLGQYNLTKENFAGTLDLAALFIPKASTPSKEQFDGMFFNQMAYKAERATPEVLAAREAARNTHKVDVTA
ncbi:hypothetical protein BZK31_17935 [Pseudomonas floridensis]|uniref:Uncharacterized protein n=1 Tax=Pseudomonas floridensis TaxID=1958950 RepID=A0A1X0N362_9PSED|nr:hypothetical protein [Pseudomonas floridensis]ORC57824.1 hypothetical protein BZK31_17935 [Pseudomonas floridensis]